MTRTVIGVMGPGASASEADVSAAYELGRLVAREGWVLLTGGRAAGVMDAASRGARDEGGLVVGVLPTEDEGGATPHADILIATGLGQARNYVNVLSSRVVVACGMGAGTAAEVALAIKAKRPVVLLNAGAEAEAFFKSLGGDAVTPAAGPRQAVEAVKRLIRV
jgi:uncharacterized protein (TIGR00725 family)